MAAITKEQAVNHLSSMDHGPGKAPTVRTLLNFLLHQLQPEKEEAVKAHVCGCKKCQLFVVAWSKSMDSLWAKGIAK